MLRRRPAAPSPALPVEEGAGGGWGLDAVDRSGLSFERVAAGTAGGCAARCPLVGDMLKAGPFPVRRWAVSGCSAGALLPGGFGEVPDDEGGVGVVVGFDVADGVASVAEQKGGDGSLSLEVVVPLLRCVMVGSLPCCQPIADVRGGRRPS